MPRKDFITLISTGLNTFFVRYFDTVIVMYIFSPFSSYIFFRWKYAYLLWNHKTSLTPTTFYCGALPSQENEQSCICVLNLSILPLFLVIFIHVLDLGDNCIVFENFTASIVDFMVAIIRLLVPLTRRQ